MPDYTLDYFMNKHNIIGFSKASNDRLVMYIQDTDDIVDAGEWVDNDIWVAKGKEHVLLKVLVNTLIGRFGYSMNDIINIITPKGDLSKWRRDQK